MPLPEELQEGMKRVVVPAESFCTDVRSGWWMLLAVECSCRADARASWKPCSSETVRFSSRDRIWSSVRTVSVMVMMTLYFYRGEIKKRNMCRAVVSMERNGNATVRTRREIRHPRTGFGPGRIKWTRPDHTSQGRCWPETTLEHKYWGLQPGSRHCR